MITPEISNGAPSEPPQAPVSEKPQDQADRATSNLGDNVRASWTFSLDNVRANIHYMTPEAKELLVWAFIWCIDHAHPLRMDEFATRVGYSRNTIWKIYTGKYKHPETSKLLDAPEKLLKGIRDFRKIELQREKVGRKGFVLTPTAKRIFKACDTARKTQTPVSLYGASQIGKTEALGQYCSDNNHGRSVLVELEAVNGLRGLLMAVAEKLGISAKANTPDLIERIKKAVTRDMVIILDEVHLLANVYRKGSFYACMETVRRIFIDHCRCGLVLTYTLLGYSEAEKEKRLALEQIFRRGVHRINLGDRPSVSDVTAFLKAWDLEMPGRHEEVTAKVDGESVTEIPFAILGQLAKDDGVKAILERLRAAAEYAADKQTDLAWEHFVIVHTAIRKNALPPKTGWADDKKEAA